MAHNAFKTLKDFKPGGGRIGQFYSLPALAKTFPKSIFEKAITYNSSIGLGGVLELLAGTCNNLKIVTDAAVSRVEEVDGAWFIENQQGRFGPYDAVVVNAPPHASSQFLKGISWAGELTTLLSKREYYKTHIYHLE
jgi:protoporphyrinogen oxidase